MSKSKQTHVRKPSLECIGEDLIQNILSRLPASAFASAACVGRSWNSTCNRILFSSPKLSSAVSFNPSLEEAVNEVINKVLSKPIRPQFALASIGSSFSLEEAHQLITEKFAPEIPVIVNCPEGIIGRDALTDEFLEVQRKVVEGEDHGGASPDQNVNQGIILIAGFFPGLKAHIMPLFYQEKYQALLIDEFVMGIKEYTSSVSGFASPAAIVLFSGRETDIKPVLQKLDYAFSMDTAIVGDGDSDFLYRSDDRNNINSRSAAVALLFAKERDKPPGIGETKFHVMLSAGLLPVGSTYKVVAAKCDKSSTWLTATRNTLDDALDGQSILDEIYNEFGDRIESPLFILGVTKRRRCSVGQEEARQQTFFEFHEVLGGDYEYLHVNHVDINSGDPFRFYLWNYKAALSSCDDVSDKLRHLKLGSRNYTDDCVGGSVTNGKKREVFGGIVFSCCGRGDSFFGQPGMDSSPFLENFPGVTFGGTYCHGEIGRGYCSSYGQGNEEGDVARCSWHAFSAVYLIMLYTPPLPQSKSTSAEPGCSSSNQ